MDLQWPILAGFLMGLASSLHCAGMCGAIGSAVLGLVVLVPYWVAAHLSGETTPWFNVAIHALGSAGVLVLLLVFLFPWIATGPVRWLR